MGEPPTQCTNLRGRRFLPLLAVSVLGLLDPLHGEEDLLVRIEPAVAVVPANHLKFYLHFPEPMERGNVFRYLRLIEIDGEGREVAEVPEPFREVELWDETFTRMTLWFHPGRQKPGVNLNVEIGPILEEGKRYRLEISSEWKTESGDQVPNASAHEFSAGSVDVRQPQPGNWEIFEISGMHVVGVDTIEILDPESAKKRVRATVDGVSAAVLQKGNLLLVEVPRVGWKTGRIVVDPLLEDLAGNSVARPFNLDLESEIEFKESTEKIEIDFKRPIPLRSSLPTP